MSNTAKECVSDLIHTLEQISTHEWRAILCVDERDRFFFDHALDHVPGMLLVEACLQTVENASMQRRNTAPRELYFSSLRFEFGRFCEHGLPTQICITASPDDPSHWRVRALQAGEVLASAEIVTTAIPPEVATMSARGPEPERTDLALVHKLQRENVLLGTLTEAEDTWLEAAVLQPRLRELWSGGCKGQRSAGELIESGRQFGTLVMHAVKGMPLDRQFVLQDFSLTLTRPLFRHEPVEFRVRPGSIGRYAHHDSDGARAMPQSARGSRETLSEVVRASGVLVGRVEFSALLLPPGVYARLRRGSKAPQALSASQRST